MNEASDNAGDCWPPADELWKSEEQGRSFDLAASWRFSCLGTDAGCTWETFGITRSHGGRDVSRSDEFLNIENILNLRNNVTFDADNVWGERERLRQNPRRRNDISRENTFAWENDASKSTLSKDKLDDINPIFGIKDSIRSETENEKANHGDLENTIIYAELIHPRNIYPRFRLERESWISVFGTSDIPANIFDN